MISRFDEYMIQQTSEPVAQPATSDRNFYGRYWNNGFDADGNWTFEIGFGRYPNRHTMDGHFSVSMGGKQYAFHASRRAPRDPRETVIGALSLEILEPLRSIRYRLAPNDTGLECDLTFRARSIATQEPKNILYEGTRCIMNTSRFTQLGSWEGYFVVGGKRVEFTHTQCHGIRDRSWGVRPIGEPEAGAPGLLNKEPSVYWVWAPLFFDTFCTQFQSFEDPDGVPTQLEAVRVPLHNKMSEIPSETTDPELLKFTRAEHQIEWLRGTRYPARAKFQFTTEAGEEYRIELTPLLRFHLIGIGYHHHEWGHAYWKGELAHASEVWELDKISAQDYRFIHTHHVCRANLDGPNGSQTGIGTLETIAFGRHTRSGLTGILDGAK